jgi:tRNA(Ile2) C34 agmatinyltransferase TiaS
MKCPKCKKSMKVEIENKRYVCECGYEIKWSKEFDENEELYG